MAEIIDIDSLPMDIGMSLAQPGEAHVRSSDAIAIDDVIVQTIFSSVDPRKPVYAPLTLGVDFTFSPLDLDTLYQAMANQSEELGAWDYDKLMLGANTVCTTVVTNETGVFFERWRNSPETQDAFSR
jgi:hypothetical protein